MILADFLLPGSGFGSVSLKRIRIRLTKMKRIRIRNTEIRIRNTDYFRSIPTASVADPFHFDLDPDPDPDPAPNPT